MTHDIYTLDALIKAFEIPLCHFSKSLLSEWS